MLQRARTALFEHYDYPLYHRITEIAGILVFIIFFVLISFAIIPHLLQLSLVDNLLLLIAVPCLAYIGADFISGMVHFLCDNFGTSETPYLGPSFIKSFRDHHTDPMGITRHDFIAVNGNNCIVSLPIMLLCYYTFPMSESFGWLAFTVFIEFLLLFVFLTNQFHKWAHQKNPPVLIKKLQRINVILSTEHHEVHHTAPHNKYYCITCGWLNPLLTKLKFFETLERFLRWAFNSKKENQSSAH